MPVSIVNALKRTVRTQGHLDAALNIRGGRKAQMGSVHTVVDKSAGLVDGLETVCMKHTQLEYAHLA